MAGLAQEECLGQERAMHCQLRFCFANIIVFPKHSMLHLDCCFVKWIFFFQISLFMHDTMSGQRHSVAYCSHN